jgi:hypothetical protein
MEMTKLCKCYYCQNEGEIDYGGGNIWGLFTCDLHKGLRVFNWFQYQCEDNKPGEIRVIDIDSVSTLVFRMAPILDARFIYGFSDKAIVIPVEFEPNKGIETMRRMLALKAFY